VRDAELYSDKSYVRFADSTSEFRRRSTLSKFALICSRVAIRPGTRLLEIGCAEGVLLRMLETLGAECHGVDISADAVMRAKHPNVTQATADALPHDDSSFDLCISSHVIEHLQDPADLLRQAARVLRPGGVLVLLYPWELFRGMTVIPELVVNGQLPLPARLQQIHRHLVSPASVRRYGASAWREESSGMFWGYPYAVPQYYSVLTKTAAS
jgi:SAM-dependent methyltransferase